jgi:hypothetical protein
VRACRSSSASAAPSSGAGTSLLSWSTTCGVVHFLAPSGRSGPTAGPGRCGHVVPSGPTSGGDRGSSRRHRRRSVTRATRGRLASRGIWPTRPGTGGPHGRATKQLRDEVS